jgi:D-sedoheptulose 7-phosphate isomerase
MSKNQLVSRMLAEAEDALAASRGLAPLIAKTGAWIASRLRKGGKVLTAGNGGSAADAMHLAEELVGRFKSNRRSLPAIALTADGTLLTCIANDFGFEEVFARQVEGLGRRGDVLVLFTTSGNSENLLRAARAAKKKGVTTIALLGKGGGKLCGKCDHEILVPSKSTALLVGDCGSFDLAHHQPNGHQENHAHHTHPVERDAERSRDLVGVILKHGNQAEDGAKKSAGTAAEQHQAEQRGFG